MTSENPQDHRQILYEWETPEFIPLPRGKKWYLIAATVFGLLLLYAIWNRSLTMALAFLVIAVIFMLVENREPKIYKVQITDLGLLYGSRFYPYHQLHAFWIVYHPEYVRSLYFKVRQKKSLSTLKIELFNENPVVIRKLLLKEVPELEGEHEPLIDTLSRFLRLQ